MSTLNQAYQHISHIQPIFVGYVQVGVQYVKNYHETTLFHAIHTALLAFPATVNLSVSFRLDALGASNVGQARQSRNWKSVAPKSIWPTSCYWKKHENQLKRLQHKSIKSHEIRFKIHAKPSQKKRRTVCWFALVFVVVENNIPTSISKDDQWSLPMSYLLPFVQNSQAMRSEDQPSLWIPTGSATWKLLGCVNRTSYSSMDRRINRQIDSNRRNRYE